MSLHSLKIGSRMLLGFALVVVVFCLVTGYMLYSVSGLGGLQTEMAAKTSASLTIDEIAQRSGEVYVVIADAVINRDLNATRQAFAKVKAQAEQDLRTVKELARTGEQTSMATEFEQAMQQYMSLFETQVLPILLKEESVAARMRDSLAIGDVSLRLEQVYSVMADAMIKRDLNKTQKDWIKVKEQSEKDIAQVGRLADTEKEKAMVGQFATHYRNYLKVFETKILPILAKKESIAKRMQDSLAISGITLRMEQVYGIMAEAIIHRDLAKAQNAWMGVKDQTSLDIGQLSQLVDTDDEKAAAEQFIKLYREYLGLFETKTMPLLAQGGSIADSMRKSFEIEGIALRLEKVYAFVAGAIISRNIANAQASWASIKEKIHADIDRLDGLVESDRGRELANAFKANYLEYLNLFENELMPLLRSAGMVNWEGIRNLNTKIILARDKAQKALTTISQDLNSQTEQSMANETQIKKLDQEIGQIGDKALEALSKINRSLEYDTMDVIDDEAKIKKYDAELFKVRSQALQTLAAINQSLDNETMAVIDDEGAIKKLNTSISRSRQEALAKLNGIRDAQKQETLASQATFSELQQSTMLIALIVAGAGVLLAMILGFLITRSITKPLSQAIEVLAQGGLAVTAASGQVAKGSQKLAEGASQQAATVEETTSTMEELASITRQNAEHAGEADGMMKDVDQVMQKANDSMGELKKAMLALDQNSDHTAKIIKTIDEIAFQTNLLALNAAVEAARAGEAGGRFRGGGRGGAQPGHAGRRGGKGNRGFDRFQPEGHQNRHRHGERHRPGIHRSAGQRRQGGRAGFRDRPGQQGAGPGHRADKPGHERNGPGDPVGGGQCGRKRGIFRGDELPHHRHAKNRG